MTGFLRGRYPSASPSRSKDAPPAPPVDTQASAPSDEPANDLGDGGNARASGAIACEEEPDVIHEDNDGDDDDERRTLRGGEGQEAEGDDRETKPDMSHAIANGHGSHAHAHAEKLGVHSASARVIVNEIN